jgi:hypothetical protein
LSIAAGGFYFKPIVQLDNEISLGYLIVPDDGQLGNSEEKVLLAFARGTHRPGKDPGSAPKETLLVPWGSHLLGRKYQ